MHWIHKNARFALTNGSGVERSSSVSGHREETESTFFGQSEHILRSFLVIILLGMKKFAVSCEKFY